MNPADRFEALLAAGKDNALLRFSLGLAYVNPTRAWRDLRSLFEAQWPDGSATHRSKAGARTACAIRRLAARRRTNVRTLRPRPPSRRGCSRRR